MPLALVVAEEQLSAVFGQLRQTLIEQSCRGFASSRGAGAVRTMAAFASIESKAGARCRSRATSRAMPCAYLGTSRMSVCSSLRASQSQHLVGAFLRRRHATPVEELHERTVQALVLLRGLFGIGVETPEKTSEIDGGEGALASRWVSRHPSHLERHGFYQRNNHLATPPPEKNTLDLDQDVPRGPGRRLSYQECNNAAKRVARRTHGAPTLLRERSRHVLRTAGTTSRRNLMTARTMTARTLFPLAMLAILAGTASTAEAVCQNNASDNYRRLLVAQPPDIFFKAGVPGTQEIPVVFVTYRAFGAPQIYNDCGATAVSSITGVSVEGTSSQLGPARQLLDWSIGAGRQITARSRQSAGRDISPL